MENFTMEKRQLCDIQGRLFELAVKNGLDSPAFMETFMNSKAAAALDDVYDRLQWAGEEYILEELDDEVGGPEKSRRDLQHRGDVLGGLYLSLLALLYR